MKFFNTSGPMKPDIHYCLPPLARMNKDHVVSLIAQQKYFVLHAPRQTGKTSCMLALVDDLNRIGEYRALYINVESAQAARENVADALHAILNQISEQARFMLEDDFPYDRMLDILARAGKYEPLFTMLREWSQADPRPVVLVIDEIDSLIGDTLVSVLRQLRSGYVSRPTGFPQSIILCGVRDVRDYRMQGEKEVVAGGSAFNIKDESLRLGNFSAQEIETLYRQHTAETGQQFDDGVWPLVWELTAGQPWLVNALAYDVCFRQADGKDRSRPVTVELIERSKEALILRRDTHLHQLVERLKEDRVRRVIEPLLASGLEPRKIPPDDIQYVRDLGLIGLDTPPAISNGIYREVIPRELTWSTQEFLVQEAAWYITSDGLLDMKKLLAEFQQFFREHSESWLERFEYKEAGPQLLLQAFLQRIVNGGGDIRREYGLGRKRTDLLITWPHSQGVQRIVLELKLARTAPDKLIAEGLRQTADYADRCDADEAHLLIFDRRPKRRWSDRIYRRARKHLGRPITVWGL